MTLFQGNIGLKIVVNLHEFSFCGKFWAKSTRVHIHKGGKRQTFSHNVPNIYPLSTNIHMQTNMKQIWSKYGASKRVVFWSIKITTWKSSGLKRGKLFQLSNLIRKQRHLIC